MIFRVIELKLKWEMGAKVVLPGASGTSWQRFEDEQRQLYLQTYSKENIGLHLKRYSVDFNYSGYIFLGYCSGYGFMGLQYGKECYCGDDYGKYGSVPDEECNKPCDGANDQMCGGTWRQSIYSLGSKDLYIHLTH